MKPAGERVRIGKTIRISGRMTVTQLSYFVSVCRTKSISRASAECFVTQPAISLAIREIEKEFGLILFYRRGNRLKLTQEGERLYEKATKLLGLYEELENDMSAVKNNRIPLRIGIAPLLSIVYFPELINDLRKIYPEISVTLFEYGSARAHELIYNDELDFALVNMEFYDIDKFNSVMLAEDRLLFYVSKSHPLGGRKIISVEDLKETPLALFNVDSVQNHLIRQRFEALNIRPDIVMHASQLMTIRKFLDEGKVGAFLFESLCSELDAYNAIEVDPPLPVKVGFIWKKGKYITSDMKKFLIFIDSIVEKRESR